MKKLPYAVKILLGFTLGCLAGAIISAVIVSVIPGVKGSNICFYAGMAVLIVGLFSCLKGNPRNSTVSFGDKGYFNAYVVMDEEKSTKAMEKHYRENHVLHISISSLGLISVGIAMAVVSHLAAIGKI